MSKTFKEKLIELGFPDDVVIKNLADFCKSSNSGFVLFNFENTGHPDTCCSDCVVSGTPQIHAEAIFGIATVAAKQIIQAGINDGSLPESAIENEELIDKYRFFYLSSLIKDIFDDSDDSIDALNSKQLSNLS